jgi:hypothetical protein
MRKAKEDKTKEDITKLFMVKFIKTYIGDLGVFYKDRIYELSSEQYKVFKNDCEEVK